MKQELKDTAIECFTFDLVWSTPMLSEELYDYVEKTFADRWQGLAAEPCGEEASWFLLLCSEACDD